MKFINSFLVNGNIYINRDKKSIEFIEKTLDYMERWPKMKNL